MTTEVHGIYLGNIKQPVSTFNNILVSNSKRNDPLDEISAILYRGTAFPTSFFAFLTFEPPFERGLLQNERICSSVWSFLFESHTCVI